MGVFWLRRRTPDKRQALPTARDLAAQIPRGRQDLPPVTARTPCGIRSTRLRTNRRFFGQLQVVRKKRKKRQESPAGSCNQHAGLANLTISRTARQEMPADGVPENVAG